MKKTVLTLLLAFSCSIATNSFAQDKSDGTLTIRAMNVAQGIKAGEAYKVDMVMDSVTPSGASVNVQEACFTWNGEGPYCFPPNEIDNSKGVVTTFLTTGNPAKYKLSGYLVYKTQTGKRKATNGFSKTINVK